MQADRLDGEREDGADDDRNDGELLKSMVLI